MKILRVWSIYSVVKGPNIEINEEAAAELLKNARLKLIISVVENLFFRLLFSEKY